MKCCLGSHEVPLLCLTDLVPVEAGDDLRGTGEHKQQEEDGGVQDIQQLDPAAWSDVLTTHEETTPTNLRGNVFMCSVNEVVCVCV